MAQMLKAGQLHPHARYASVVFDADSTLANIEGIDWLGALRGPAVGQAIQDLTNRAMAGELPLEQVYAARLDTIRPTLGEIELLGAAYVAAVEPGAVELMTALRAAHVHVAIVSGGLRSALLPLGGLLGVPAQAVHGVDIVHDARGLYVSLAPSQPLSRQDGKPRVVRALGLAPRSVMVGDGSTDAAVRGETNAFIAYTRVARRPLVVASADAEARNFTELHTLLFETS